MREAGETATATARRHRPWRGGRSKCDPARVAAGRRL